MERVAVVGIGQTKHDTKRDDVSIAGLVREAAQRALDDAGMTYADIDAVVLGKAADMFEGVMMPELYLADALGCAGKPMMRVHTAGSVGGSTALVAVSLVESGVHERVLTVAFEKQSESDAMWALSRPIPFAPPTLAGGGGAVGAQGGPDCAADLYRQAGITAPGRELDVAEIYVPFSWYEAMWMENLGFAETGSGWKMTDDGSTSFTGDMPVNPSGGVLS